MRDRRAVAIVASCTVVGILVAAVLWWGVLPTPRFLAFVPGGDGFVAHQIATTGDVPLVAITDLTDGSRVVVGIPEQATMLGFDDGSLVMVDTTRSQRILVDPATGEQNTEAASGDLWDLPEISVRWQVVDGLMVIERQDTGGTVTFPAPDTYTLSSVSAFGDDRIAFADQLGRVMVGTVDGGTPMLVADDAPRWSTVAATAPTTSVG